MADRLRTVPRAQLREDAAHVVLGGLPCEMQAGGDLRVGETPREEDQDLLLPLGQARGRARNVPTSCSTRSRHRGRRIESNASDFTRLDQDGLVVEEHRYYDVLTLFPQVGAVA